MHKLNKKGGAVNFDFHSNIYDFRLGNLNNVYQMRFAKPDVQKHYYTDKQHEFLNNFFNNWIKEVKVDNEGFTDNDIQNSRSMSCGSFGCGVLFPHEKSGKKYIFKVIENERTKDLLKETYLGYYMTGNKFKVSNRIVGFINSQDKNVKNFSSIVPNIKFNYDTIIPKRLENIRLFILILEAGNGDLTNLSNHMLNQYNESLNGKITNIDKMPLFFHQVNRIICQSLDISNFIKCHKVADKCVFFNHMDIKPPNFIFLFENNNYEIQAIDFGLSKMNNYFYKLTDKFYTTPLIADTVFGYSSNKIFNLLFYDLSATLLTIILSITHNPNSVSVYDNKLIRLIKKNLNIVNAKDLSQLNIIKNYIYKKLKDIYTENNNSDINKFCLYITERLLYCFIIISNIYHLQNEVYDNNEYFMKNNIENNKNKYLDGRIEFKQLNIDDINKLFPKYSFTSITIEGEDYDIYRKIIQISKNKLEYDNIMI